MALRALYALEMSQNAVDTVLQDLVHEKTEEGAITLFASELVKKTAAHVEEFDVHIKEKTANWDFDRIAVLDKLILRMALCEFLYFEDIPPKVSINEAIEIAKKYSTEKSSIFINGVLDSILADLRNKGKIVKVGRGLLDK